VAKLLDAKNRYKTITGKDWTTDAVAPVANSAKSTDPPKKIEEVNIFAIFIWY
jgi:hypothetical protein